MDSKLFHQQVKEREERLMAKRLDDKVLAEKYRKILLSDEGLEVLWDLLGFTHVFHTSFDNSGWTNFREGERSVGLYLLHRLGLDTAEGMAELVRVGQRIRKRS